MLSLTISPLSFQAPVASHVVAPSRASTLVAQEQKQLEKASLAAGKKGEFCYGLPGALAPFSEFDPFNFLDGKTYEQVRTWREAELAHCRVGILASAGFLVQEKFHPLFSGDGGPAIEQIP